MQGWLWLLIFGALFYLMMRYGCGAHMVHGEHGGHQEHPRAATARDPVCGMSVDLNQSYSKKHGGREYHFCSLRCLEQFDTAPQRYMD